MAWPLPPRFRKIAAAGHHLVSELRFCRRVFEGRVLLLAVPDDEKAVAEMLTLLLIARDWLAAVVSRPIAVALSPSPPPWCRCR
jgi:hypothetical protein